MSLLRIGGYYAVRIIAAALFGGLVSACSAGGSTRPVPAVPNGAASVGNAPQSSGTISPCTAGFYGDDITINTNPPNDVFIAAKNVVKHFSAVAPGAGPCSLGTQLADISLGNEMAWGVALDRCGNLYVTAGASEFSITEILKIAPPYTGTPAVFYGGGVNLRSLAVSSDCNILYAADFGAGTILRFDLSAGPHSVRTFAAVPGVFGIVAAGVDNLFATSNGGFTGCASGVGTEDVKHVTSGAVSTIAAGLAFPEGIGSDGVNLYVASGTVVYAAPVTGGTPALFAGDPIAFSHGVTVWQGGVYVTDSSGSGHVWKVSL